MIKRLGGSLGPGPLAKNAAGQELSAAPTLVSEKAKNPYLEQLLKSMGVADESPGDEKIVRLRLGQLQPGASQPRHNFIQEPLEDLAESIRAAGGIIQPLIVRTIGSNRYEIVAGERRWRAAAIIDLHEVPCIVRDDLSDKKALIISLIENIQREDLNPMDEAEALSRLVREFGMSHLDAANAVGKSRSTISNLLRLTDLPADVRDALRTGAIEMGHARAMLGFEPHHQQTLLSKTITKQWSVREVEAAAKRMRLYGTESPCNLTHDNSEYLDELAAALSERAGEQVVVKKAKNGSIIVTFRSEETLAKICK